MFQTRKQMLPALLLALVLLTVPVLGALAAPAAGETGPWGWLSALVDAAVERVWAASGDEAGASMDPDGYTVAPETDAGPEMDPDGVTAGPGMDPNGGSADAGPSMDPNG